MILVYFNYNSTLNYSPTRMLFLVILSLIDLSAILLNKLNYIKHVHQNEQKNQINNCPHQSHFFCDFMLNNAIEIQNLFELPHPNPY